ncbi:hypothetical protein JI58_00300, partial [Marinosulfonomonas sp. PRT-SC04]
MGSTAMFADVTSAEVWADWQAQISGLGYEISANEIVASDGVTVDDLSVSMKLPDDKGNVKINFGTLTFKNQGDGTVAVTISERMPMTVDMG